MLFATWEFFNPFLKNDALFTTGCLHFPAHVPLQRSVQVLPNPCPAPFNLPASYETVVFEHSGDPGIFLPPEQGFCQLDSVCFSFRSVATLPVLLIHGSLVVTSQRLV